MVLHWDLAPSSWDHRHQVATCLLPDAVPPVLAFVLVVVRDRELDLLSGVAVDCDVFVAVASKPGTFAHAATRSSTVGPNGGTGSHWHGSA